MSASAKPIKIAVIPAAGFGSRMVPATKVIPKEMLPFGSTPLIQRAVEEALEAGIEKIILVVSEGKQSLLDHFKEAPALMASLVKNKKLELVEKLERTNLPDGMMDFVMQDQPLGLGHAVWCAREKVGNEPFAVILPDDTVLGEEGCLRQMVRAYQETGGNVIAACVVPDADVSKYGIFDLSSTNGNVLKVKGLVEKPALADAPSNVGIFGRYILQPEIFGILDKKETGAGGEIQLTDAMAKLMSTQSFHGFVFKGERHDCGSKLGLAKAQLAAVMSEGTPAEQAEILSYMKDLLACHQDTDQKNTDTWQPIALKSRP